MPKAVQLKKGDACPSCGGAFKEAPVPTDAQRDAAADKENPVPFPPHFDSASKVQRAELGALSRCTSCGYAARFAEDDSAAKPAA